MLKADGQNRKLMRSKLKIKRSHTNGYLSTAVVVIVLH